MATEICVTKWFRKISSKEFGLRGIQMLPKHDVISRHGRVFPQRHKVCVACFLTSRLYKVPRLHMLDFVSHLHVGDSSCSYLPPFGLLPFLKYLCIQNMDRVLSVGLELYGEICPSVRPFPSLEILIFREMLEWRQWIFPEIEGGEFPQIQELLIQRCPKLKWSLPKYLPHSTKKLRISKCPRLLIPKLPSKNYLWLTYDPPILEIEEDLWAVNSNKVQLEFDDGDTSFESDSDVDTNDLDMEKFLEELSQRGSQKFAFYAPGIKLPSQLYGLKIEELFGLRSVPGGLIEENPSLRDLSLIDCPNLESFHGGHPPIGLEALYIRDCRKLEFLSPATTLYQDSFLQDITIRSSCDSLMSFPLDFFPTLKCLIISDCANLSTFLITKDHMSLRELHIKNCPKLLCFPKGRLRCPKLRSFCLSKCKNLKVLPDQLSTYTSLRSLYISECPELKSIPKGGLPHKLYIFRIYRCHKLIPCIEWGMFKLKNLGCFAIEGCGDLTSFPERNLLPSSLDNLWISGFVNLELLNCRGLQQLTSLKTMTINSCNKLQSLPRVGLPSSLRSLYINDCSLLKSKFLYTKVNKDMYFSMVHIPRIQIDGVEI